MLAAHELFRNLLNGNQYSITTMAAFYKNPFMEGNDLKGIYQKIISADFFCSQITDDAAAGANLNQQSPRLHAETTTQKRNATQMRTIEATLMLLKQKQ